MAWSLLPTSEFSVRGTGLERWTGFLAWHVGKYWAGTEHLSDCKAMAQLRDTHTLAHTHPGWGWDKSQAPSPLTH